MELIEIRDLDGPNLFALRPVMKIELALHADELVSGGAASASSSTLGIDIPSDPIPALLRVAAELHRRVGLGFSGAGTRELDTAGRIAAFHDWEWRETSLRIAQLAFDAIAVGLDHDHADELAELFRRDQERGDLPLWVRDPQRRIPSVGITGTNGKTTTTRLIAHIVRLSGKHVGWSSSSGVYIDGEQVMEGDYTGPSGARRVLQDPAVDVAVLETARGGILLRGLAYESNDVGVFLNVTADHLDMQGVERIETLAEVKSVVVRVTRPDGLVVLNADDPLVLSQLGRVRAPVLLFTQISDNPVVQRHVESGGRALVREQDTIVYFAGSTRSVVSRLSSVPMTYGGAARHMVENALAGAGAALGLGLSIDEVADGLRSFRSDLRSNIGRLNVFRLEGRIVVVDYAHNESGLEALLGFARSLMDGWGRLLTIIGTAGDRQDSVLEGLGQIAARDADLIFIKENPRYLRGRSPGTQTAVIRGAVVAAGAGDRIGGEHAGEHEALIAALDVSEAGDAIAIMCVEEQIAVFRELRDRGAQEWE